MTTAEKCAIVAAERLVAPPKSQSQRYPSSVAHKKIAYLCDQSLLHQKKKETAIYLSGIGSE